MGHFTFYKQLDLSAIAEDILALWKKENTFAKSLAQRQNDPKAHFYEGPPGANGLPGIHHVFCRTLKDIFCRYKTMRGYFVERKSGWDTHGLPVEMTVENELGITKKDIGHTISIAKYNQECKKTVLRYQKEWESITERIGYWLDLQNPYVTCDNHYISAVWGIIKALYQKGYIYKGHSIQPFSPVAGTGLSNHELNQPGCYKEVKDVSLTAQFAIIDMPNTYFLAWTTTPWTLPANSALAVNPHLSYVKVNTYNRYTLQPITVILATSTLERFFQKEKQQFGIMMPPKDKKEKMPWQIVANHTGKDFIGCYYKQLLPYIKVSGDAFRVIPGDFVNADEGTGIVHIAPTFGADDAHVAKLHRIPAVTILDDIGQEVPIVDRQGRFVQEITDFAGRYVKSAYEPDNTTHTLSVDTEIAIHLKKSNRAFCVETYQHSYPHCWRTDKPILYYPLDAWFIKTTACKEKLIARNHDIRWQPTSTGQGRFGDWLKNLVDWNITRDRFWGTPLPIWSTKDQQETICIGSIEQLRQEVKKSVATGYMETPLPQDFDLHRPYVDNIILVSSKKEKMFREPGVFDVWGDSGAMPYAQHATGEKEIDTSKPPLAFPANFIIEGIDQTRGWFFTLHTLAVMLHDQVAFKNVLSTGLVLDKNGQKMSKRLGNVIDPNIVLDQYGPDVLRWYMIGNADPWDNLKFDITALSEVKRKFFSTLYNTYQFFALYANLDNFTGKETLVPITTSDKWILSRLQHIITNVSNALENLAPTQAIRTIQDFTINELSNWYVRLNRKRFSKRQYNQDKQSAYQTLHHCLVTITKLAAPIAPFYMDHLYRDLIKTTQTKSVHLVDFPIADTTQTDHNLEKAMAQAQTICSLVHSLRKKHNIKVRQPLQRILLPITSIQKKQIETVVHLILNETNVKHLEFINETHHILSKKIKPNYTKLGKIHGPKIKEIQQILHTLNQKTIAQFEKEKKITLLLSDKTPIHLTLADVILVTEDIAGWAVAKENNITVALDLHQNQDLIQEGIARELVSRLQNIRKKKELLVDDKITLTLSTTAETLQTALQKHQPYIMQEVQIKNIIWESPFHFNNLTTAESIELDEGTIQIAISKA